MGSTVAKAAQSKVPKSPEDTAMVKSLTKRNLVNTSDIHRLRYVRHRSGESIEEIAKSDHVATSTVSSSISMVEGYRQMCTLSEMEAVAIDTVIFANDLEKRALSAALEAVTIDENGNELPDHNTRFRAMDIINDRMTALLAKNKAVFSPVQVNVAQQNNNNHVPEKSPMTTRTESFEDRVRRLRDSQRARQAPLAAAPDIPREFAETIEGDVIDTVTSQDVESQTSG